MKKPPQSQHSSAALLPLADLILGHARRLENMATWRDVLQRHSDAKAAGEHLGMAALLRHIQASRFAGMDTEAGFFIVCHMAERHAETIFETDRQLNELSAKLRTIEEREGLGELDEFILGREPADWKVLAAKSDRRFKAVEKIERERFIR